MKGTIPKYYVRTYEYAQWIRNWIIYDLDNVEENEFYELDLPIVESDQSGIVDMLLKPSKYSYLHYFIDDKINIAFEYEARKFAEPEDWNKLTSAFLNHKIDIEKFYSDDGDVGYYYKEELESKIKEDILPKITEEVFSILFYDKEFLFSFNSFLSNKLVELTKSDFSILFNSRGDIHRAKYWPKWLQKAIFYRERGRCSYCFKDISGLLNLENKINLDHIIPLGNGGTNDTSNIQLTCETCNKKKQKKRIKVKEHRYYKVY